jgi:hypothetical protein
MAANEETAVLSKRLSANPDIEKAMRISKAFES